MILVRLAFASFTKSAFSWLLFFILYTMQEMIIAKWYLEEHYKKQYEKLNELLGTDWYIYQYYTIYYLVVGECETSFISLKMDLDELINGIGFWLLLAKHWK